MTPDRRFWRHFLLTALALGCLYLAGRGRLAPPPLAHPSRVPSWWAGQGPVVGVFSATRLAVLIAGMYWLILLSILAAVGALSPRRLARVAPSRRLVGARRAVRLALGASALGSALTGGATPVFAASLSGPGPAPTITNLAGPGRPAAGVPPAQPGPPAPARPGPAGPPGPSGTAGATGSPYSGASPAATPAPTARAEPSPTGTTASAREPEPTSASAAAAPGPTPRSADVGTASTNAGPATSSLDAGTSVRAAQTGGASRAPAVGAGANRDGEAAAPEWIVRPGDNLWFIAEQTLAATWGRSPSDRQVAGYWISVIAANRSRLPDPSDPSLLFAGDVIMLPPVPSG